MKGFSKFYTYKGHSTNKSVRKKLSEFIKYLPSKFKKITDVDTFEDKILSDEKMLNDLIRNYKEYGKKSYAYMLSKYSDINATPEYKIFLAKLSLKTKSSKSFIEKYGWQLYKGHYLLDYLDDFKNGIISQDELNNILAEFKKTNEKYKKSGSS